MRIKTKLCSVFCLSMALMGVALVSGKVAQFKNEKQLEASEARYLSTQLAEEFISTSRDLTRYARTYVVTRDKKYDKLYWDIVKWRNGEIPRPENTVSGLYSGKTKPQIEIMQELNFSEAEFALLKKASELSDSLIKTETQAMQSVGKGAFVSGPFQLNPGEIFPVFATRILFDNNYHAEVTKIMGPVNQFLDELNNRTAGELKDAHNSANAWMGASFIFQFLAAIALIFTIIISLKYVLAPLNYVAEAMHEIGMGDGDLSRRLPEKGNDEITSLARGFNSFASNVMSVVQNVGASVEEISTSSSHLATTAGNADRAINQQKQSIDQVSIASNNMFATVQRVEEHASSAAVAASQSDAEASQGMEVLQVAIGGINCLTDDIEKAAGAIGQLEEDSNMITSVLDVIRGIAEQTNLLALNAAIEAARAGDQGRGFAVVADEVRNLAQRTQNSTQEIQDMIERLQNSAVTAVKVMEKSRDQASSCVVQAAEAGTSLQSITQAISEIKSMNSQISTASEEQSIVMGEINQNITHILQQVDETSEGSRDIAENSDSLHRLSQGLKGLVGQFKVS